MSDLEPTVGIAVGVTVGCIVLIAVIAVVIVMLHRRGLLKKRGMIFGCASFYCIIYAVYLYYNLIFAKY